MLVPQYWSEARRQHRAGGRTITVRRFGWSDLSADDAHAMAEQRADDALRRLVAGEDLPRREPKLPYNGAAGVPIREEVLARHGDEVVTRNAYGARCLNTPNALFADVDFEARSHPGPALVLLLPLALLSIALGRYRGSWALTIGLLLLSLLIAAVLAGRLARAVTAWRGGAEAQARRRIADFLATRPGWSLRVYRTPAGLRLLATHRPFDPTEPEVQAFFEAVNTDPVYVHMSLNQRCFRARLTAKPWRIGMDGHLRPRPGVWPVDPARLPLRHAWVADYERKAAAYAACRFVDTLGSGLVDLRLQPVVDLHDRECRALQPGLPIA